MVKGKQNKALLLQHGGPTDNMETSLCLVIEFLSDLHNVLAVSLSYAHLSKLSLCLFECPHGETHSYARIHMHTHRAVIILSLSYSYSSTPDQPSSASVVSFQAVFDIS